MIRLGPASLKIEPLKSGEFFVEMRNAEIGVQSAFKIGREQLEGADAFVVEVLRDIQKEIRNALRHGARRDAATTRRSSGAAGRNTGRQVVLARRSR